MDDQGARVPPMVKNCNLQRSSLEQINLDTLSKVSRINDFFQFLTPDVVNKPLQAYNIYLLNTLSFR